VAQAPGAFILQVGNSNPTWSTQYAALENVTDEFGDPIPVGYTSCPLNPQQFILQNNSLLLADGSLRLLSRHLNPLVPPFPAVAYRWEFWSSVDDANGYLVNHNVTNTHYVETQCSVTSELTLSCTAFNISGFEGINGRLAPRIYIGAGSVGLVPMDLNIIYLPGFNTSASFNGLSTSSGTNTNTSITLTGTSTMSFSTSIVSTNATTTSIDAGTGDDTSTGDDPSTGDGSSTEDDCGIVKSQAPGAFFLQVSSLSPVPWSGQHVVLDRSTVGDFDGGHQAFVTVTSCPNDNQQFIIQNNSLVSADGSLRLVGGLLDNAGPPAYELVFWTSLDDANEHLVSQNDTRTHYVDMQCSARSNLTLSCTARNITGFSSPSRSVNPTIYMGTPSSWYNLLPYDLDIIYLA
jgi:hypothetical protein